MAFSSSKVKDNVEGVVRKQYWSVDFASVTSGTLSTGLSSILHVNINNLTTEGDGKAVPTAGAVALSGFTSNDVATIEVVGF